MTNDITIAVTTRDRPALTLLAVDSARSAAPEARIIVVDSGSSPENVRRLQMGVKPGELHVGSYPNAAAARNAALALVDSEFIGFLDSDDLMRPAKITCLRPLLRGDESAVLAGGRTAIIDADGVRDEAFTRRVDDWFDEGERSGTSYVGLCKRSVAYTSATLMRRAALEEVDGFDEALPTMEDWDLYLRLSLVGKIATARCVAADYRIWGGNMSSIASAEGVIAVAMKHLANLPSLAQRDRRRVECALSLRTALSFQTLLRLKDARRSLARAVQADPTQALASGTFWRILGSSLVPAGVIERRRSTSG
jgi:GT2 family glycosyltransferase